MRPPLKQHVPPLNQPLFHELVAALSCLPGLAAAREEYSTLLVLDGHEIRWYLDVNDVGSVGVRPEVVHEQVVGVVNEEVQGVEHLFVVANQRHFEILVNHLLELRLGLVLLMDQLYLPLLLRLLEQEIRVPNNFVRLLHYLVDLVSLHQKLNIVPLIILQSLFRKELLAHIRPLVELLGPQLNIYEVSFLQDLVHLIHLLPLQLIDV